MRQGSDDGELVRVICQACKVLADLYSWNASRDRLERPSHFGWGIRLEVKRIELTGPAPHKQKDASLSRFDSNATRYDCRVSRMEAVGHSKTQTTNGGRMQKTPTVWLTRRGTCRSARSGHRMDSGGEGRRLVAQALYNTTKNG